MPLFRYYPLSALFNLVTSFLIGLFVLLKNRRSVTHISFALFSASVCFWALNNLLWQVSAAESRALFFLRGGTLGSTTIPVLFYHFVLHYLGLYEKRKKSLFAGYGLWVLFFLFSFTPYMVKGTTPFLSFRFSPVPGSFYPLYLLYFLVYSYYAVYLLYRHYHTASGIRKNQIRWFMLGIAIGLTGGCTNYPLWWGVRLEPAGNMLVSFYPLLVGYAIIRYKAMEIDTVIHKTLMWLLSILLLILPVGILYGLLRERLFGASPARTAGLVSATLLFFIVTYNRLKGRIDHFFRRRKYDYQLVLADLPSRIGSSLDLNVLTRHLFVELGNILYTRNLLLLVRVPEKDTVDEAAYLDGGQGDINEPVRRKKASFPASHPVVSWLMKNHRALERERVELDREFEPGRKEALELFRQSDLELLLPLTVQGIMTGILGLGKKENLQAYRSADIRLLENVAEQIALSVDNALHHEDILEKERFSKELRLGQEIQTGLLPQKAPEVRGLALKGLMFPAREIGGDYYDFIPLPKGNGLAVVIGDVAGKGVAAGLLMAMVKTAVHIFAFEEASPKNVLLRINEMLFKHIGGEKFMTMLYCVWKSASSRLVYSSAGHETILYFSARSAGITEVISGGTVLGVIPDIGEHLEEKEIPLRPGDRIMLYTDGAPSAKNNAGERFGLERLKESFARHGLLPAGELIGSVHQDILSFTGSCDQYDDITLVVLEAL